MVLSLETVIREIEDSIAGSGNPQMRLVKKDGSKPTAEEYLLFLTRQL